MPYFIGLDVGTSGVKALLVNLSGEVGATVTEEYPMSTPKPLWAEQNPEDWWQATAKALQRLLKKARVKPADIKAIGLTGQMHGLVMLDRDGNVLRPCIMWNDQRTGAQCEAITRKICFDRLLELTGNPVLPGFTAPKVVWVRENEPEVFKRAAHILLPKDYIRFCLTGQYATEVSDASGTSLFDVKNRNWSAAMLEQLEIPAEWMPRVYESPEITGMVTKSAAEATGLSLGTPVVGGGSDQAAGAVGSGIVRPGIVSVTIGTSGVVFAHCDSYTIEPKGKLHAFCHAVPSAWHLMGVTLSAGGSLRWFRDTLGENEKKLAQEQGVDPYELLTKLAEEVPAGSEGLIFLPYLSGERTPYPDPHAKGVFLGLTVRHKKAHMIRSVLEGVVYSLRDCLELIRGLRLPIREVRATGGGARSPLWRHILADVLEAEIVTVTSTEGAPYGAALLAGVGVKEFTTVTEACERTIKATSRTEPNSQHVQTYRRFYEIYRSSYSTLKPLFEALAKNEV